jgi:8-hydroxy-5-deazaflavin:NADPH oxidoreductase
VRIGVLGTGMVGHAIATKLVELGHEVRMGSRDAANEKAVEWARSSGERASHGTFNDAAEFGELVFNCSAGMASLDVLAQAGEDALADKVLVDVANTLDFSHGRPPTLAVCNTDSLGEQIQRNYPKARVVKALNTMNCEVMVNPGLVPGQHDVFVCGEDGEAKAAVASLLETFGWSPERIVDLGGIASSRGTEMYLPLWLSLMGAVGGPHFNIGVVR